MAFSGFSMLGLLGLPVLVAQWVGVLGLRRTGTSGAWWTMVCGLGCTTIGMVVGIVGFASVMARGGSSGIFGVGETVLMAAMMLPALGSLLFGIGFALHGLKASRAASRLQELEQLTAAMSEEINQLRQLGTTSL